MAQTFTYKKLSVAGENKELNGLSVTKRLIASCVGPATSVNTGMTLNLGTHFASRVLQGTVIARKGSPNADIDWHYEPAAAWTPATGKMVATRRSTGVLLSSAVVLTGERVIMEFYGA